MKITNLALPLVALGTAAVLIMPGKEAMGFSTIGGLLNYNQRDFRVYNNFSDSQTNNNNSQTANFPGWDGAELAIWKGCVEWNSLAHGDGSGDPSQSTLGNGGANFDAYFAGAATNVGGSEDNIHSAISSCSGGTLAFTETPIANGWRIRYCENWTWQDGPGSVFSGIDLQGVACHEYGHALGLGHSGTFQATMYPSINGSGTPDRSIHSDDIAGVQSIYGARTTTFKPIITGISINGNQVTISGSNFSNSGGEVWFTNKNVTAFNVNPRVRLTGVVSNPAGTSLTVTIPPDAGPGQIMVKRGLNSNNSISNSWPFDGMGSGVNLTILGVTPSTVQNLIPGTAETITVAGAGFTPSTTLEIDGNPIAGSMTYIDSTLLTFEWEPTSLGARTLTALDNGQSDSTTVTVFANSSPTIQAGNGDPLNLVTTSADITVGDQPGSLAYVVVSPENVPSVLPGKINLGLGNVFSSIFEVGLLITDANGIAATNVPLPGIFNTDLYWQHLRIVLPIAANYPLQESNLQSTHVQ